MESPPLVTVRARKCKSVKPLPTNWKGHLTCAPDPHNEDAHQCSFEWGDHVHLQRKTRVRTMKDIVKNNPSVKRLKLSGDEEALEEIWQEVTKMLRMDPAKEGIFIPYNP